MVIAYVERNYADDGADTVSKLVADMHERDELGLKRYSVKLTAHNGRDHMIDAYQELLDFVVYTRAWLDEHGIDVLAPGMPTKASDPDNIKLEDLTLNPRERTMMNLFCAATEALLQLRGMLS